MNIMKNFNKMNIMNIIFLFFIIVQIDFKAMVCPTRAFCLALLSIFPDPITKATIILPKNNFTLYLPE